jgi:pimeloyl-ACP methyl ester carboxylesterase
LPEEIEKFEDITYIKDNFYWQFFLLTLTINMKSFICSQTAIICFLISSSFSSVRCQNIPFGNNPDAGKYVQTEDAKIYYEIYGDGRPLLLLHGGLYGYISEYSTYLPELTKNFKVIAVALRGHGKSEIGVRKYTFDLFAEDAKAVLNQEGIEKTSVMGFSDGSTTGLVFAVKYPGMVEKLVCLGGRTGSHAQNPEALQQSWAFDGEEFEKTMPDFMKERKKIMPEPERFAEWANMLKNAWLQPVIVKKEDIAKISCPTFIIAADKDFNNPVESYARLSQQIPNSRLMVLPNAGHVALIMFPPLLDMFIIPFLKE